MDEPKVIDITDLVPVEARLNRQSLARYLIRESISESGDFEFERVPEEHRPFLQAFIETQRTMWGDAWFRRLFREPLPRSNRHERRRQAKKKR